MHVRSLRLSGLMIAAIASAALSAQLPAASLRLKPGKPFLWSSQDYPKPVEIQVGEISMKLQPKPDDELDDMTAPHLVIEAPGRAPIALEGEVTPVSYSHQLAVGRLDPEHLAVLFQSTSGGAHCCNSIQLAVIGKEAIQTVDLGAWDGDYLEFPKDLNGDGRADFRLYDNGFLYAFTSYGGSDAPPVLLNVIDGKVVDVSADPSFRPLFAKDAKRSRKGCLDKKQEPNGSCAAYLASAARAGIFDAAWAEMLKAYNPKNDWDAQSHCDLLARACSEALKDEKQSYPDRLRAFLIESGYLTQ